jgi:hypothetical protein
MQKENQNQAITLELVMPIVNKITDAAWNYDPTETRDTVQEMFELLMLSDVADTKDLRERAYFAVIALREMASPLNELCSKTVIHD